MITVPGAARSGLSTTGGTWEHDAVVRLHARRGPRLAVVANSPITSVAPKARSPTTEGQLVFVTQCTTVMALVAVEGTARVFLGSGVTNFAAGDPSSAADHTSKAAEPDEGRTLPVSASDQAPTSSPAARVRTTTVSRSSLWGSVSPAEIVMSPQGVDAATTGVPPGEASGVVAPQDGVVMVTPSCASP